MSWNTTLLKRSARLATSIGTVVLAALALGGCVGSKRQSRRREWPTETPRRLDLAQSADRAQLRIAAESGETLTIPYAAVSPARRKRLKEYAQTRGAWIASVFRATPRTRCVDI